ncbi:S53 family peptidase [Tardisphaera saccharovorans]
MQLKAIAVLALLLMSLSALFYPVAASGPEYRFSYYVMPLFAPSQASSGIVHVGFAYPEGSPPYAPRQIASYYGFSDLPMYPGLGETIVIVDAFGSPTIYRDLAVFDSVFQLPPANLQVIRLPGPSSSTLQDREGWAVETSLDVEWAHAMAPYADIVLVEASSDSVPALYRAVEFAVDMRLGQVISMSWGLPEPYEEQVTGPGSISSFHQLFEQAISEGITPVASSGDDGAYNGLAYPNVNYPASDPYVLAVGGTNLTLSSSQYGTQSLDGAHIASTSEYLWVDSGGGVSSYFEEPSWQSDAAIEVTTSTGAALPSGRAVPDVSYVAMSPYGPTGWAGLWIYDSTPYVIQEESASGQLTTYVLSGWYGVGGTSCGAPQWSALIADLQSEHAGALGAQALISAVAGQMPSAGTVQSSASALPIAAKIYSLSESYQQYFNVIKPYYALNNNGYYYYSPGWDAITGWGSPRATALLEALGS